MTAAVGVTGRRAGFVTRLAALVADALILWAGLRGSVALLLLLRQPLRRFLPHFNLGELIIVCAPGIVGLYHVAFWWLRGQTPGKWLLGVKVVALGGGKLTLARSLLRLAGYVVSALPAYLGFLWILRPERRGFHDRLAGTEVVYTRPPARPRPPEEHAVVPRRYSGALGPT